MTEDQAKPRTVLYGLLIGSILLSLVSMLLSWQRSADRNRRMLEVDQQLIELNKQVDELEAKTAEFLKLKAEATGDKPVAKE